MEPNDQQCAGMALQFLDRVQLTGQEVPAFTQVVAWLNRQATTNEPA
ncbi:hypothetical protein PTW37_06470 [Arthrobacter agilis]|nr:hypothetical protein [Arthrobacter agilis]WDF34538.1 hypothetical protein PTW37_06470 [Arthrobacter agilis]